jgi:SAM-dependent methyltransferase
MTLSGVRDLASRAYDRLFPPSKGKHETRYWRGRAREEGTLGNWHYEGVFTTHFDLGAAFFAGKRVLDVGCGPRGSLEWAHMAAERVGLDPLADTYREFGIDRHTMKYVTAPAEKMPFEAGSFDVVTCLNALDHVDDLEDTIAELTRVAADGATLLVMVETGHPATSTEPQEVTWDIVDKFAEWDVTWTRRNGVRDDHQLYQSIDQGIPYRTGPGLLRARLVRKSR